MLAAAGTAVLVRAWVNIAAVGQALPGPIPGLGLETIQACQVDRAIVARAGGYESFAFNAYPLPYELVLTPICVLPAIAWQLIAVGACLLLGVLALRLWRTEGMPAWVLWPALLTPVMIHMVQVDQIFSAIGLFGISLAAWAQHRRRWVWLGIGVAIALIRPINALPVLAMIVLCTELRNLAKAAVAGIAVAAIPLAAAWLLDSGWVGQYLHLLATYRMAGIPQVVARFWGPSGLLVLSLLPVAAAAALAGRPRARPLELDRAALALALSVVAAPLQGLYVGVFALPALVRLAGRAGAGWIAWVAVVLSWVIILATSGVLLGSHPVAAYPFLSALAYWLLLNSYPLLRRQSRDTHSPVLGAPLTLSEPADPGPI